MKELINTFKKIEEILYLIENLLKKENHFLSHVHNNINILNDIIKKKEKLFKKFSILNQEKNFFEKKNSIFEPYINQELHYYSRQIKEKCILLRDLNHKNKIIMNQRIYLNQYFLELFVSHNATITDDDHNDLKI